MDPVELYDKLVSLLGIERRGKNNPYTSLNGNMYSLMKDGRLGIRLSKADREAFIQKYSAEDFITYGAKMREYVEVPVSLLENTEDLAVWMKKSHEYAKTLKPK